MNEDGIGNNDLFNFQIALTTLVDKKIISNLCLSAAHCWFETYKWKVQAMTIKFVHLFIKINSGIIYSTDGAIIYYFDIFFFVNSKGINAVFLFFILNLN